MSNEIELRIHSPDLTGGIDQDDLSARSRSGNTLEQGQDDGQEDEQHKQTAVWGMENEKYHQSYQEVCK